MQSSVDVLFAEVYEASAIIEPLRVKSRRGYRSWARDSRKWCSLALLASSESGTDTSLSVLIYPSRFFLFVSVTLSLLQPVALANTLKLCCCGFIDTLPTSIVQITVVRDLTINAEEGDIYHRAVIFAFLPVSVGHRRPVSPLPGPASGRLVNANCEPGWCLRIKAFSDISVV